MTSNTMNVTCGTEIYFALSGLNSIFLIVPGATRFALAPGYHIARLRRWATPGSICAVGAGRRRDLFAPSALATPGSICAVGAGRRRVLLAPSALGDAAFYLRRRRWATPRSICAVGAGRRRVLFAPSARGDAAFYLRRRRW